MIQRKTRFLALLLAAAMLLSVGVFAAPSTPETPAPETVPAEGTVTIIVELEEAKAFPLSLFSPKTPSRAEVKDAIREIAEEAVFGYDYSVLLEGFSLTADAAALEAIRDLPGVRNAFIAETYRLVEPEGGWANALTQSVVGALDAHKLGYTGKGQVIAVLDTGFIPEHEAFSGAVPEPKLSQADVTAMYPRLHAADSTVPAEAVWCSSKVPFCFDYYDEDAQTRDGTNHGMHVSGIAAANAGEIIGVAPDAQLVFMKVFNPNDRAVEDCIIAALEDAVVLGADSVNMSLGTPNGFTEYRNETERRVYENLRAAGVTVCVAAGNAGIFAELGWPNPLDMPDGSTVDSPGCYEVPLSVANLAVKNIGYLRAGDRRYPLVDAASGSDGTLPSVETLLGEVLPAVDCGDGSDIPESVRGCAAVIDVREYWGGYGPIFRSVMEQGGRLVVFRSEDEFFQNESGFRMQGVDIPLIFVKNSDAEEILSMAEPRISVDGKVTAFCSVSNSSAWGPTSDLKLKPEIAAVGDHVYSSVPGEEGYDYLSGTSMASPQVCGEMAVLYQYLKAQSLKTPLSLPQLAETLLMSTATPAMNLLSDAGTYISPLHQGAGIGNVADAIGAKGYLTVPGCARPKAELGAGEGPFTFSFTVHNLTDAALRYRCEVQALAQDQADGRFDQSSQNYAGNGVDVSVAGAPDGVVTVPAGGDKTVTVTLTVTDLLRETMRDAVNGFFLDGFVRLYAEADSGSDLGLPYMAFVGDWNDADLLDLTGRVQAPRLMRLDGSELGENPVETVEKENWYGDLYPVPYVDPEAASISPAGDYINSVFTSETVLLRNAASASAVFTDASGRVISQAEGENLRRSSSDLELNRKYLEPQLNGGYFSAEEQNGEWLPEGWYTYTVSAKLAGGDREASYSRRIYVDPRAPELTYAVSGETGSRTLTVTASDNFRLSYFTVTTPDSYIASPENLSVTDRGMAEGRYQDFPGVKSLTKEDGRYTLTLDLEVFIENLKRQGLRTDLLKLEAQDYARNAAVEIIPLSEDFYPYSVQIDPPEAYLSPGEERQLHAVILPENCPHDKIVWESWEPDVVTVDENGLVHAVSEGYAPIYAIAECPEGTHPVIAECWVNVFVFVPSGFTIWFDPMGGTCPTESMYTVDTDGHPATLLWLPPAEREGYTFLGWFLEQEGGEPVEPFYDFTDDTTLYAHWAPDEEPPCDGGDECPSAVFADVDRSAESWYHLAVDWAVTQAITDGTSETTFSPELTCTRAQMVTFLWRAAGKPAPETDSSPFLDVKDTAYYRDAVLWAVEKGITDGVSDTEFDPNGTCTRAHIVTFLYRAADCPKTEGENPFDDVPANAWYTDAVLWAAAQGITQGKSDDAFDPHAGCTRAEAVTFLARAYGGID